MQQAFPLDLAEFKQGGEYDGPIPEKHAEALRFLVNKPFLAGSRYKAQQHRANRQLRPPVEPGGPPTLAHPDILAFERAFVKRFQRLGVPMFAHCIVRTRFDQDRLYRAGNSLAKAGDSPHQHGLAVDLIHGVRAWEVPKPCWDLIAHVGKETASRLGIKVIWGGDWRFYDPAHWELASWRSLVGD